MSVMIMVMKQQWMCTGGCGRRNPLLLMRKIKRGGKDFTLVSGTIGYFTILTSHTKQTNFSLDPLQPTHPWASWI